MAPGSAARSLTRSVITTSGSGGGGGASSQASAAWPRRGRDGLEGGDEIAQELVDILIALVESEPGDRARRGCQPGSQEGGLTCAGRSREQRATTRFRGRNRGGPADVAEQPDRGGGGARTAWSRARGERRAPRTQRAIETFRRWARARPSASPRSTRGSARLAAAPVSRSGVSASVRPRYSLRSSPSRVR